MKSIKLLMAALVVSATFAACSKDEAPVPQTNEVVGAELVGTNISVDFTRNTDTKLTDNGWEATDELGLAWATNGTAGSEQTNADGSYKEINKPGVAANHLFAVEDGSEVFSTKGNVYKGWHFGYYPFRYMEKPGELLDFEINPAMTSKWSDDYYASAFYLSAREFLTKEKHLENNKLTNVTYQMERVVNTIGIRVTPSSEFADPALSGLNITKLTISAGSGNNVFTTGTAVVIPAKLAKMQYDEDDNYDADATREAFFTSLPAALKGTDNTLTTTYTASTTISKEAGLDLSGAQLLRLHTLPVAAPVEIKPTSVKFTIAVNGGSFSIGYTKNAEEGTPEAFNNKAIEAFVAAYAEDGSMTSYYTEEDGEVEYNRLALDLKLTPANFKPSYSSISNIEEWNDAVAVADALGTDAVPTFTVDGDVKITAKDVPAFPKNGLTVHTKAGKGKIVVAADYVMPEELAVALHDEDVVVVNAGATLTIEDGLEVDAAIENKGTIKVGVAEVKTINNKNRVEVVYGSKVNEITTNTVAYNVLDGDSAYMINQMINNVHVNTLVIADDVTLDLSMKDKNVVVTDPYYTSVTPGQTLLGMDIMNFELNNGTLKADANTGAFVKNIKVTGGDNNSIWNVNVEENLTVTAGKVLVDAASIEGHKNVVKVNGGIINKGELVANATMFTSLVSNPTASKITVNPAYVIWYTNDYEQGGSATGKILKNGGAGAGSSTYATLQEAVDAVTAGGTVTLQPGIYTEEIELPAGKDITLKSSTGNPADVVFTGRLYKKNLANSNVIVKNITITGADAVSKPSDSENYAVGTAIYDHYGDVNTKYIIEGCIVNLEGDAKLFKSWHSKGSVTIKNCKIVNCSVAPIQISGEVTAVVENNEFYGNADAAVVLSCEGGNLSFKGNDVPFTYGVLLHKNWSTAGWTITTDSKSNAYMDGVNWTTITVNKPADWTKITE